MAQERLSIHGQSLLSRIYSVIVAILLDFAKIQKNSTRIPFLKINDDLFCNMLK